MSSVIGNLHAVLGLDSTAFQKGMGDVGSSMRGLEAMAANVQRSMAGLQATMQRAGAIFGALGLAVGIRGLADMADTWSDLQSRVGLAVGSMDAAGAVMQRLSDVADRTYSSIGQTTEGFLQNATTLRDLGLSTAQALDYTEALNNAMVVSGAKGDQATRVQTALSNAMALGALRGDNLNTILTAGGRVSELLAEELGVTTLQLRKMGMEGKITADVILRALVGNMEKLREEADEMPATIGDAFVRIGNAMQRLVGTWDKLLGSSSAVSGAFVMVAENLQRLTAIAIAFGGYMAGRYVVAIAGARDITLSLSGAFTVLRGALIRTGIGALVVGAGELIYQFSRLVERTGGFGNALKALGELGGLVWKGLKDSADALPAGLAAVWAKIKYEFYVFILDLQDKWSGFMQFMAATTSGTIFGGLTDNFVAAQSRANDGMEETLGSMSAAMTEMSAKAGEAAGIIEGAFAPVGEAWKKLQAVVQDDSGSGTLPTLPTGGDSGKSKKGAKAKTERPFFEAIEKDMLALQRQFQLIGKTKEESAALQARWEMLDEAKRRGIPVNEQLNEQINTYADRLGALTGELERAEIAQQQFDQAVDGIADAFAGALVAGESFRDGMAQVFKQIAADLIRSRIADMLGSLASTMGWGRTDQLAGALRNVGLPAIPAFATGVAHFRGGMATINERGGELAIMPSGSTVIPHDLSKRMIDGGQGGGKLEVHIHENAVEGPTQVRQSPGRIDVMLRKELGDLVRGGGLDSALSQRFGVRARP